MFQFIGEGAKKSKLRRMARDRKLDNVEFLPYQPLDRRGTMLSAADIGVVCLEGKFTGLSVPSKTYGIMAAGTPILGFLDGESEIGRTIREHKCGVVLENPSGEQVSQVLSSLIQEPERLKELGRRGHCAFKSKFTLNHVAERYDGVLQKHIYGIQSQDISTSTKGDPNVTSEAVNHT
jgi:glycosyltransferase involved in cell wall biosynthesis